MKKERPSWWPTRFFARPGPPEAVLHTVYNKNEAEMTATFSVFYRNHSPALFIHCTGERVTPEWAVIRSIGDSPKNLYTVWCPKCRAIQEAKLALRALTENP